MDDAGRLRTHIANLRAKLDPFPIQTAHGVGYRFAPAVNPGCDQGGPGARRAPIGTTLVQ